MAYSIDDIVKAAREHAVNEDVDVVVYPEPGLGKDAYDYMEYPKFERNGHFLDDDHYVFSAGTGARQY